VKVRCRFLVSGRVQGVGFRYFTQTTGIELGLTGWARNLADGRVEAEAQGSAEVVREFAKKISKGPVLARVTNLVEIELPCDSCETTFSIK
jgi:acylphosphatase